MIDYRELLKKYIKGVIACEGVAFEDAAYDLSKEEEAALDEVLNEIDNE